MKAGISHAGAQPDGAMVTPDESERPGKYLKAASFLIAAAFGLGWTAPAQAQTLDNDYWITAAAYFPRVDTNVRISSTSSDQVGTDLDLERDLALDKDEVLPDIAAGARFGRVLIGANYFRLRREGTITAERDIVFDDVTYPASAEISSRFDTDIYRLTIGYAFVQKDDLELGGAIGVHATEFDLALSGEVTVGEEQTASEARRRDFLAPLPTLGLFGTYRLAPKLELNGRVDYLSLSVGDYDGRLVNAQASVTYRVLDNVGIGAAYRYVDYRVDVEKDNWEGRVRYKLYGPALILQASF